MTDRAPKNLDPTAVHAAWIANGRNLRAAGRALGVSQTTVKIHVDSIEGAAGPSKDAELLGLRAQVRSLEKQLTSDDRVLREILKLEQTPLVTPEWLTRVRGKAKHLAGVPTFFASDFHWGEVVRPAEIGGVNEYNMSIASTRLKTFVDVGIELLRDHLHRSEYEGCVFVLGGDMLSGDIHDELSQTNEVESMPALLDVLAHLKLAIARIADEFGRVFVPCVTGNHGRTSRKPRAKRRNHTNFDWLLYQLLRLQFAGDKRITFLVPEGPDAYYRVYGTRYLLTHGDQFRGGDGMIGALGPISRGAKKKAARNVETDHSFDVMLLGHWHQYIHLNRFIVNGALKGYDEYAYANNFDVEPAQQALWVTHPEHGITFRMPVFVQHRNKNEKTEWVSVTG